MSIPDLGAIGSVSRKGYEGWTELVDTDFAGINNPVLMQVGKKGDRMTDFPSFSPITVLKRLDRISYKFFQAVTEGIVFKKIFIHYLSTSDKNNLVYFQLELFNVITTHFGDAYKNASDNYPIETITLNYNKIKRVFTPHNEKLIPESPIISCYDLDLAQLV